MRQVMTILSLVAMILTISVQPQFVQAAGQTGHSDWERVKFMLFGLDVPMAQYISGINQSLDDVPGAAATKSGVASEIIHFSRVVTKTDLMDLISVMKDVENDHHDIGFFSKVKLAMKRIISGKAIGDSTGAISNPASVELLNRATIKGDVIGFGMGTHIALDAQGFHNGYKGAMHVPFLFLDRVPVLRTVINQLTTLPFGHLVDGTSVDRLSIGKMALSIYTMGDYIVTLRRSLKDTGVNHAFLGYLQSQGVDVDKPESVAQWFFNHPEILPILQNQFPANRTNEYFESVLKEVAQSLAKFNFFKDEAKIEELLKEISANRTEYQAAVTKNTTYEQLAMRDFIRKAKERGMLNEKVVIRETITDYFSIPDNKDFKEFRKYVEARKAELLDRTQSIDSLVQTPWSSLPDYVQDEIKKLHGELSTEMPFSENWILDQIAEKLTRNMVHYRFSRFNTAYLNEEVEQTHIEIERKSVAEIEKVLLKIMNSEALPSKYFYTPGKEHRAKVREELFNFENYKGMNTLEAIVKAMDIIVKTKLIDGSSVTSLPASIKFKIFLKTMAYLTIKKVSPITTKGGYFLRIKELQDMAVNYLAEKNPEGIMSAADYEKIKAFNEKLNLKYNSDSAVGFLQKTAALIQKGAISLQGKSTSVLRCEALFN